LLNIIKQRRSIRKFEEKKIEKEKLESILKGALMAPSSRGRRPWDLVIVRDKEKLAQLSQCKVKSASFLTGADVAIVVVGDPEISDVWIEDTSIVATILQLEAQDQGLGSCWIQVRNRETEDQLSSSEFIKDVLCIPEKYSVECVIAMGYPAQEKAAHDERQLPKDKIHYDKW